VTKYFGISVVCYFVGCKPAVLAWLSSSKISN